MPLVRIISTGMTPLNQKGSPSCLMQAALQSALNQLSLSISDIKGLIAVPSLAETHFMEAHYFATRINLLPGKSIVVRTVDTGGAGPVTALLEAKRMVLNENVNLVAVVAGDAVKNLSSAEFLKRADQTCYHPSSKLSSPVIPNGYNRVAEYHLLRGLDRKHLAMCASIMSYMSLRHPSALTKKPNSYEDVLASHQVASATTVLECARRADGGAALLVASQDFLEKKGLDPNTGVVIVGGGEGSGPLYPPLEISEDLFSCEQAAKEAYQEAQLSVRDIDFFGLYDCFPICLIRAIEGLAPKGQGGQYIENKYFQIVQAHKTGASFQDIMPINTHGGLLAFGAPWEVPAMYNIIEAFFQLTQAAEKRQIRNAKRALVYGNGGIFSHSAVAILGNGKY